MSQQSHPQSKQYDDIPIEQRYKLLIASNLRCSECKHLQKKQKRCVAKVCNHWCCYEPVSINVTKYKTNRNRATVGTCLAEFLDEF